MLMNAARSDGTTSLRAAAANGHNPVVRALLIAGADVDSAAGDGATPMFAAAENGHSSVVHTLLHAAWFGMETNRDDILSPATR